MTQKPLQLARAKHGSLPVYVCVFSFSFFENKILKNNSKYETIFVKLYFDKTSI
jgi:hypothetical protein